MKLVGQTRFELMARSGFYTDVVALDSLCSPEAVARLHSTCGSLGSKAQRNFLRGYRLAIAIPLRKLLFFVVDSAELLGIEADDRLYYRLHYGTSAFGESLRAAISDPTSDLGLVCSAIDNLAITLRRAGKGLDDTVGAIERCRTIAKMLRDILSGAEFVSLDTGESLPDKESLLRLCMAERVWDYFDSPGTITATYRQVWGHTREFDVVDDYLLDGFLPEVETHLSDIFQIPSGNKMPRSWAGGLWFGLGLIIELNGIDLPAPWQATSDSAAYRDWRDQLEGYANQPYTGGYWPTFRYGIGEFSRPTVERMVEQLEVNMDTSSPKQRLEAILGPDNVRLMSDASPTDAIELDVMLSGAVVESGDSRVRLLILRHSVAREDMREWVSIAFRLPVYGSRGSNVSKWFLFYKMYHPGHGVEPNVARNARGLEELLQRFENNLHVEEISGLDSEDFLPLCTLPAFQALRESNRKAVQSNSDLRAVVLELLATIWLTTQGYQNVKVSFKSALLGVFEYDAIGVKDGQCLVVEVKSTSVVDEELRQQIIKFADKLDDLRGQLPELTQALESEDKIEDVTGLFVFLGDLDDFDTGNSDPDESDPGVSPIELWDYDYFVEALRAAGLPQRVVKQLNRSFIAHTMPTEGFPDDLFSVGL